MPFAPDCKHKPKKGSVMKYGHGLDAKGEFIVKRAFCQKCRKWYLWRHDVEEKK